MLPLDAICTTAELNARQVLNEQVLAKEYVEVRGVSCCQVLRCDAYVNDYSLM